MFKALRNLGSPSRDKKFSEIDFNTEGMDLNKAKRRFMEVGCAVLRQAINRSEIAGFDEIIKKTFSDLRNENNPNGDQQNLFRGIMSGDDLSRRIGQNDCWFTERIARSLSTKPLATFFDSILQGFVMVPQTHIRFKPGESKESAIPYHQHFVDGDDVSSPFLLAVSIPFTPYDEVHPRMEIVATNTPQKLEVNPSPETRFPELEIPYHLVQSQYKKYLWAPHLEVGDIFVFRETNIHRTFVKDGMSGTRTSVDVRLVSTSRTPTRFEKVVSSGIDLSKMAG